MNPELPPRFLAKLLALLVLGWGAASQAALYSIKPGQPTRLQDLAARLQPGDVVEIAGDATYPGDVRLDANGTAAAPIIIRGLRVNGHRPIFSGVNQGEAAVIRVTGNHYVLDSLEVTGGGDTNASRGIRNVGDGCVLRDVAVYACPRHGILNSDAAGSLTLSQVEVYDCGFGEPFHQIYVGMDNVKYPNATFRMEFCHVHQGNGGNNVKSRAGRSEIYYNWIEGASGRELELLGPDRHGRAITPEDVRAHADVVGNLIYKSGGALTSAIRVGGDGSGTSRGRARFVNNTILISPKLADGQVFKLQDELESLEAHNNVFYRFGKPLRIVYDPGLRYRVSGQNNWIPSGSTHVPREWKGTLQGLNPGFVDLLGWDLRPNASSPLRGAGRLPTLSPEGCAFPQPLPEPLFQPRRLLPNTFGAALKRPAASPIDIGAFATTKP